MCEQIALVPFPELGVMVWREESIKLSKVDRCYPFGVHAFPNGSLYYAMKKSNLGYRTGCKKHVSTSNIVNLIRIDIQYNATQYKYKTVIFRAKITSMTMRKIYLS